MSNNRSLKESILASVSMAGLLGLGYSLYTYWRSSNDQNKVSDNFNDPEKGVQVKDNTNKQEKDSLDKNKEEFIPVNLEIFVQVLTRVANNVIESLISAYDVIRDDFNPETGIYRGNDYLLTNSHVKQFKVEIIKSLQNQNLMIISGYGLTPDAYNSSLKHYLETNK